MARTARRFNAEIEQQITDLRELLATETPENQRQKVMCAVNVIVGNGWLFAVACAKAGIIRGRWYGDRSQMFPFIDQHNAEFEAAMKNLPRQDIGADMLERWNAPDF